MGERPLIAAMLETGDSFLHLQQQKLERDTVDELGYQKQDFAEYTEYVSKALRNNIDQDLPNYHTVSQNLIENPRVLYEKELLRPHVHEKVDEHLDLLRDNRDRSLNRSEIEAVINTTIEQQEVFPRKAIDKEKLLDNLYIGIYSSVNEEPFHEGLGEHPA